MADLKKKFEKAVADSKKLPEKPDNATLLQIYGAFQAENRAHADRADTDDAGDPGDTDHPNREEPR